MKNKLYFIIPLIAIILILLNAFFGHLIFGSPYGQDINKFSIYVHLQPEWNSSPANIIYEVTNVWSNPNPHIDFTIFDYDFSDDEILTDYNSNQLQYQKQKSFVELKHGFSNCENSWRPPLYRYAIDSIRNNIEFLQGTQLTNDPYISIYPNITNNEYDSEKRKEIVRGAYVQFIPICTSQNSTSYEFAVSMNDKNNTFDIYFVPSEIELKNYLDDDFTFYNQEGCFATNHHSFSGVCNNVEKISGLLIIIPDNLKQSLTKVKISLHEKLLD